MQINIYREANQTGIGSRIYSPIKRSPEIIWHEPFGHCRYGIPILGEYQAIIARVALETYTVLGQILFQKGKKARNEHFGTFELLHRIPH